VRERIERRSGTSIGVVLETSPCRFFESDTQLCAIHRRFGAVYKPPSCRHFPRIALLDARGVSLTLSHYCPTAASMLFRSGVALCVVENPSAFPPEEEYEGLDAREVLPPLLRPGLLWDLDGYSTWEAEAISLLGRADTTPESALAELEGIAADIEACSPDAGPLQAHVERAFRAREHARAAPPASRWGDAVPIVNRYLAARLFASWVPYQSDRLSALVRDLAHAHTVLSEEARQGNLLAAIRAADHRIVHARC
jgi:hypothetical protein